MPRLFAFARRQKASGVSDVRFGQTLEQRLVPRVAARYRPWPSGFRRGATDTRVRQLGGERCLSSSEKLYHGATPRTYSWHGEAIYGQLRRTSLSANVQSLIFAAICFPHPQVPATASAMLAHASRSAVRAALMSRPIWLAEAVVHLSVKSLAIPRFYVASVAQEQRSSAGA